MAARREDEKYCEKTNGDTLKREHFLKPDSDQIDLNLLLKAVLDISEKLDRDNTRKSTDEYDSKGNETTTSTTTSDKKPEDYVRRSVAFSTKIRPKSSHRYDVPSRASPAERKNMSFSNSQVLDIDRENQRLLKKIGSTTRRRPKPTASSTRRALAEPMRVQTAAEVNRQRFQRKVDHENQRILSRLQSIKPTESLSKEYLTKEAASQKRFCSNSSKSRPSSARSYSSVGSRSSSKSSMSHGYSESSLLSATTSSDRESVASSRVSRASTASRRSRKKSDFPKPAWEAGW